LLIVDEIGYLSLGAAAGNLFFQLVNARYERGAMILTSNRGFAEWGLSSTDCSTMPLSLASACRPSSGSPPSGLTCRR
jgi:DNA replication protein DnaC